MLTPIGLLLSAAQEAAINGTQQPVQKLGYPTLK